VANIVEADLGYPGPSDDLLEDMRGGVRVVGVPWASDRVTVFVDRWKGGLSWPAREATQQSVFLMDMSLSLDSGSATHDRQNVKSGRPLMNGSAARITLEIRLRASSSRQGPVAIRSTALFRRVMSAPTSHRAGRGILDAAVLAIVVAVAGLMLGHPAMTLVASGILVVWVAILLGSSLTRRLVVERDPGRELFWNLLLVGVVLLALVGVGLMSAPLS